HHRVRHLGREYDVDVAHEQPHVLMGLTGDLRADVARLVHVPRPVGRDAIAADWSLALLQDRHWRHLRMIINHNDTNRAAKLSFVAAPVIDLKLQHLRIVVVRVDQTQGLPDHFVILKKSSKLIVRKASIKLRWFTLNTSMFSRLNCIAMSANSCAHSLYV